MRMSMLKHRRTYARQALRGAAVVAGAVAAGVIAGGYYVASAITRPGRPGPRDEYTFSPFELGIPYEDVTFMPDAGDHYVRGWWLPRPETRRVVIACTGYRAKRSDLLGISSALWRAGNNVLLFDFHGHGAGLGAPITLAHRELSDFLGALDYARRRVRGARIGVIGFSMGAAVAVIGSARRPEVRALVADSCFATHEDEIRYSLAQTAWAPAPLVPLIARVADHFLMLRAGYRHRDVVPLREIGRITPRPLLLIHSTTDETIAVDDAYRLYDAAGEPKELWIGDATSHCGVYFIDRAYYCRRVADFFAKHLGAEDEQVAGNERAWPVETLETLDVRAREAAHMRADGPPARNAPTS
jgi:uncharacterized protein